MGRSSVEFGGSGYGEMSKKPGLSQVAQIAARRRIDEALEPELLEMDFSSEQIGLVKELLDPVIPQK